MKKMGPTQKKQRKQKYANQSRKKPSEVEHSKIKVKYKKIKQNRIKKTGFYSWCIGRISNGCNLCVKGRKLVLFVTGLCSRNCYYCPLSDQKKNRDVIFANERPVRNEMDMIEEARISGARGASITGGDPFIVFKRTLRFVKILKSTFGRNFHIHLYAPTELITEKKLKELYKTGLDEIRFHPDLYNHKNWEKIELALKFRWDVGIEIPAIPGLEKQSKDLIDYANLIGHAGNKIKFININELEISDTNANKLLEKGFMPKNRVSYGIKGSQEFALKFLRYCYKKRVGFNLHYCTARLKDRVQLANRIKIRAHNVKEDFDMVTEEGMLLRGAIYLPEIKPGFSYNKRIEKLRNRIEKLKNISKRDDYILIKELKTACEFIEKEYGIPKNLIKVDNKKFRILTGIPIIQEIKEEIKKMRLIPAIVSQYPTFDELDVFIKFL